MEPWAFLFLRGLPGGHWCPCAPREAHVPKAQNTWLAKNAPDLCSQRPLQSAAPAAASPDAISQVSPTLPCGQVEATPLQGHRVYAPRAAPPQAGHTSHPVPETPLNWQAISRSSAAVSWRNPASSLTCALRQTPQWGLPRRTGTPWELSTT